MEKRAPLRPPFPDYASGCLVVITVFIIIILLYIVKTVAIAVSYRIFYHNFMVWLIVQINC